MTLDEFHEAFAAVRAAGWIESKRRGDTGVGHTLEKVLGLKENNLAIPDLGTVDLKAHRQGSSSLITLFTFDKQAWRMKAMEAVRRYGTPDENGRKGLFYTMAGAVNKAGLRLVVSDETIAVEHANHGIIIAQWRLDAIYERILRKVPGIVFVEASHEVREGKEWFRYENAILYQTPSMDDIRTQISTSGIYLDLRLRERKNHGTAFRVRGSRLPSLFKQAEEL